ncbi:MAG: hypothetical protein E6G68_07125 [Actinobacteria bacterium]|nr:MAG: hypothetical protein E6G68_07125 [Actinomycetota bacterium]
MREGNGGRPHDGRAPEPAELEAAILRIQGIQAARVVAGPGGRVSEVHVLAGRERGAKQLVRDVQSVILTNFGVDIDYRTVSVVQLDEVSPPKPAVQDVATPAADASGSRAGEVPQSFESPRPAIVRLVTETASFTTEVRVGIELNTHERAGSARGPSTSGLRLVAGATVDAIGSLLSASAVEVQTAELMTVGLVQMAVVVLRMSTPRGEQTLTGSAIVRKDANDATARATLDALNRVLSGR